MRPFHGLTVRDPQLAGALASVGVPPHPTKFEDSFSHEGRLYFCWHFLDRTIDGADRTVELLNAWANPEEFNAKHPHHRFAYIMLAFKNADGLRKRCAKRTPLFLLERGASVAMVDPNSPIGVQEEILARIGI